MHFVALLQSAQDGNGVLDAWFFDHDRLETALEGGILLDVFAVFVERGGPDGPQFAAGQLRLEHVRSIGRTLGGTGADDGVQFVDEEDDLPLARGDFFEEGFETFLEFAAEFGAGDHRADIHGNELFVLERFGNVAADNTAGETFDNGRLAHAGLADENRVVFRAAGKHLHGASDFLVTADDRIDFAALGQFRQVAAVFLQRLVFFLGILVGDTLRTAHFDQCGHQFLMGRTVLAEEFSGGVG